MPKCFTYLPFVEGKRSGASLFGKTDDKQIIAIIFVAMVWHCESLGKPDSSLQFDDKSYLTVQ
jgi:hypothetical protein